MNRRPSTQPRSTAEEPRPTAEELRPAAELRLPEPRSTTEEFRPAAETAGTTPGTESCLEPVVSRDNNRVGGVVGSTDKTVRTRPGGLDLYDLARFPMSFLSETPPPKLEALNRLEFTDGDRRLVIQGDPEFRLMRPPDVEVFVVLQQRTQGRDPRERIRFRLRGLLRELGWADNGKSYARLALAVRRLHSQRFTTYHILHDVKTREFKAEYSFHLIPKYRLCTQDSLRGDGPWESWIRWDDEIAALLAEGYHHSLDVATFLGLKTPTAQAAMRYLSAIWRRRDSPFEQHLATYAERLGVRERFPAKIRERIHKPHLEVVPDLIGGEPRYGVMETGAHKGEPKIILSPGAREKIRVNPEAGRKGGVVQQKDADLREPHRPGVAGTDAFGSLALRLTEAKVEGKPITPTTAATLVATNSRELIERQLRYWPQRRQKRAGGLIDSIRENWDPPQSSTTIVRSRDRSEEDGQSCVAEAEIACTAAFLKDMAPPDPGVQLFDDWWLEQPEGLRAAWIQAVLDDSEPLIQKYLAGKPEARILEALRSRLITITGWKPEWTERRGR
jgi:hypothetical protein